MEQSPADTGLTGLDKDESPAKTVILVDISREFSMPCGRIFPVLKDKSFEVGRGEFITMIGASGTGKKGTPAHHGQTDVFRRGTLEIRGNGSDAKAGTLGVVFQRGSLCRGDRARKDDL